MNVAGDVPARPSRDLRDRPHGRWAPAVVIGGLVLGLALGAAAHVTQASTLVAFAALLEPLGTLWVNAILMTVIPLVISSLVVGVCRAADAPVIGRLLWQSVLLFVLLTSLSAAFTVVTAPAVFARVPVGAAATTALRVGTNGGPASPGSPPGVRQWLVTVVPANAFKAAAEGAMLPLVVFTLAFALALLRVPPESKHSVVALCEAVGAAMRVVIGWVLACAPVGVFALATPLAARLGTGVAGALASYVLFVSGASILLLVVLYPLAVLVGRLPLGRFVEAVAPAQLVAFSARSSLAALPALIQGAESTLALPATVSGVCLPLAVSTFKYCVPVVTLGGMLFTARLHGITIDAATLLQVAPMAVLLSFTTPGVPAGGLLVAAPLFTAAGVPLEGIGLLIALDMIADMFRAPANVTADLAVAAILARFWRERSLGMPMVLQPGVVS